MYNENEQRKNSENLLNRYKNDDGSEFISFQSTYSGHLVRFLYCEGSYKVNSFYSSNELNLKNVKTLPDDVRYL